MWTFLGSPYFVELQAKRLGGSKAMEIECRNNKEAFQIATLVSQLEGRCRPAPKDGRGKPVFPKPELDGIKGTLVAVERLATKLHMLAGAAHAMLAQAYDELGIGPPKRSFEILADADQPTPIPPPSTEDFADEILMRLSKPDGAPI